MVTPTVWSVYTIHRQCELVETSTAAGRTAHSKQGQTKVYTEETPRSFLFGTGFFYLGYIIFLQ